MLAASLMVGGLMPLDYQTRQQWPPSGAWRYPVGDGYAIAPERSPTPGPWYVLRSVEWDGDRATHQGADLGCGKGGGLVHAAAAGVVVRAEDHGDHGGYGTNVVLAHRLAGGVLAYSMYAHLRLASLRVHAGQCVQAGQTLGRVGMTGHATAPHLHFEVRAADDPLERWEFSRVEDPLAFVEERLPNYRADTTGIEAFLEWGECAALLSPGARGGDALTREAWWRMLAAAVKGPLFDPGLDALSLRDALIKARILSQEASEDGAAAPATWNEVAHDASRSRHRGLRSGPSPLRRVAHRRVCEQWLGSPTPVAHLALLSGWKGQPTLSEAVTLIAALAGPRPDPPKPPKPVKRPIRRIGPPLERTGVRDTTLGSAHAPKPDSLKPPPRRRRRVVHAPAPDSTHAAP